MQGSNAVTKEVSGGEMREPVKAKHACERVISRAEAAERCAPRRMLSSRCDCDSGKEGL